jgi:hypothetical protein
LRAWWFPSSPRRFATCAKAAALNLAPKLFDDTAMLLVDGPVSARVIHGRHGTIDVRLSEVTSRSAFVQTTAPAALRDLVTLAFQGVTVAGHVVFVPSEPPGWIVLFSITPGIEEIVEGKLRRLAEGNVDLSTGSITPDIRIEEPEDEDPNAVWGEPTPTIG